MPTSHLILYIYLSIGLGFSLKNGPLRVSPILKSERPLLLGTIFLTIFIANILLWPLELLIIAATAYVKYRTASMIEQIIKDSYRPSDSDEETPTKPDNVVPITFN